MTRRLVVASLNYSSWSVRAWLALRLAKVEFRCHRIGLFVDPDWRQQLLQFSGAAKVPVLVEGALSVHESLAICEYAAELAPGAGLWPADRALRARARAIASEMATGFFHLRRELPMNNRLRLRHFEPSEGSRSDIARVCEIWDASVRSSGGPFLFGAFGIADCMYLPVCSRFRTYGVALSGPAATYQKAIWEHPLVREWDGLSEQEPAIALYDPPAKSGAIREPVGTDADR